MLEGIVVRLREELGADLLAVWLYGSRARVLRIFATEWLGERRAIHSFFTQEVDRDKLVLWGEGLDELGVAGEAGA